MDSIIVTGGHSLSGRVAVGGAKNSALKLMAASLLARGVTSLSNVPDIADISVMAELLEGLGVSVQRHDHWLTLDATDVASAEAPYEMVARMRASISVLGALVGRIGRAHVAMPGGCNIGSRKVDMHLKGLEAMGAEITTGHGYISAIAPSGGLSGADIYLDFPSVGATENLLMAAVTAGGTTTIENAAREPEIIDLASMLVEMGARISGHGSSLIEVATASRRARSSSRPLSTADPWRFAVSTRLTWTSCSASSQRPGSQSSASRTACASLATGPFARWTWPRCRIPASPPTCRRRG